MTTQTGRAFNEWLRTQLKAKKMSQRQLAQQSGVDHSTISRLIRGDRMPSLGTATALARGRRAIREDADTTQYLGLVTSGSPNPAARVEYSLRSDDALGEAQVRQVMEYYLAVRVRRFGRVFHPTGGTTNGTTNGPTTDGSSGESGGHLADGPSTGSHGSRGSRATIVSSARLGADGSRGSQAGAPTRIEPMPAGSRPLGYAHLPPRSSGIGQPRGITARVSGASTLTRPPGRNSGRD